MFTAAKDQNWILVKDLIEQGADVNAVNVNIVIGQIVDVQCCTLLLAVDTWTLSSGW